jgi:4-hydroxy-4-methyl-2-oxoglutarate aldolase
MNMQRNATALHQDDLLNAEELAALQRVCSPTISNAIETFNVRPRGEGVTNSGIRCLFPGLGPVVGYASTALIISGRPALEKRLVSRTEYWEHVRNAPGPRISIVQDLSDTPGGAYWGEVNSNIHLTLGSLGVITNGTVRDLEEVSLAGFHLFASGVSVSHGFAHLEDFNRPVTVFGMTVHPDDLIHADLHGAVVIPGSIAREVVKAVVKIEREERKMIDLCRSKDFSIAELDKLISPEY